MRLFIAINFDKATKDALTGAQDRLRGYDPHGKFVRRENIHLTLAFIGETSPERVPELQAALDETPVPSLELTFDRAGRFRRGSGDIWWIGLAANPELTEVRRALLGRLSAHGFRLKAGEFIPHVTLARDVTATGIYSTGILAQPFSMTANRISLMLSERVDGELRYTELY